VAWRIAGSQAVLFGDDPQVEYAVDERLRIKRVTAAVALGCAPAVVLVGLSQAWITPGYELLGTTALIVTYSSFAVAMLVTALATRRLRTLSATFANGTSG